MDEYTVADELLIQSLGEETRAALRRYIRHLTIQHIDEVEQAFEDGLDTGYTNRKREANSAAFLRGGSEDRQYHFTGVGIPKPS